MSLLLRPKNTLWEEIYLRSVADGAAENRDTFELALWLSKPT